MRVKIESTIAAIGEAGWQARILNGYREGELLELGMTELPMRVLDRAKFVGWLQEVGYEVVNPEGD